MRYFAYGANMHTSHFKKCVPDAEMLGVVKIKGYQIKFNKIGNLDGSGKCNIIPCKNPMEEVYGVLYQVSSRSRYLLDKAERLGYGNHDMTLKAYFYDRLQINQKPKQEEGVYAFTYIAHQERIRGDLMPFTWYKDLVLAGAIEHQLPQSYIDRLESYVAIDDPNVQRAAGYSVPVAQGFMP